MGGGWQINRNRTRLEGDGRQGNKASGRLVDGTCLRIFKLLRLPRVRDCPLSLIVQPLYSICHDLCQAMWTSLKSAFIYRKTGRIALKP